MKTRFVYTAQRLLLSLLVTLSLSARADFTPIPLTADSYNQDMVVEKTGPAPLIPGGSAGAPTTASMDGGISNGGDSWNEQGYFSSDPSIGIPAAGSTISTNNHQFTFAPSYTASNAIMLDVSYFTNSNFRLSTPRAYAALSFLTSGGNGGCQFRYTVQRQDGTTDSGTAASPDWFNVTINIGWIANGRVHAQNFTLDNANSQNPRLYYVDVTLPASSSPITNINIQYVSGNATGHSAIMALAGASTAGGAFTPILGTGYNADIVVEATAPKRWDLESLGPVTTASMDGGVDNTGDSWFEQGYYSVSNSFGLPAAGSTFAAQDDARHQFRMAPSYTENNAVFLDPQSTSSAVTFTSPTALTGLSVLTASGGGTTSLEAVVHHADGSTETLPFSSPDWFGNTPIGVTANGRINVQQGRFENLNSGNPRLYYVDLQLADTNSPVTGVDFNFLSTANRAAIFALSGTTGALSPTITQQPVGVKTSIGSTAQFTVTANGTAPLSYQWQKGTNGNFVSVSGAANPTLDFSNVQLSDLADFRVIVSNAGGSVTSSVVSLVVISPLQDVTQPGDQTAVYQPNGGNSPAAETVEHAIDNDTAKYFNGGKNAGAPFVGPVGFTVTPASGRTVVSGLRLYTANDAPDRDPADYLLEGSNDGLNWTAISSGPLSLPDARNAGGAAIDPAAQNLQQLLFTNSVGYSTYRLSFSNLKNNSSAVGMQIGEVEFLGVADTSGFPAITAQPQPATVIVGGNAQLSVTAVGNPAPTYQWRRLVNGNYVDIAGATGATLNLNNVGLTNAGSYVVVVSNSVGNVTSLPVQVTVISNEQLITSPSDVIEGFGDQSGEFWGENTNAMNAIDNAFTKWQSGGSGFSAAAGFPPFQGPVGLILTPAAGATVVTGLRIFTAGDAPERDPADYTLEGSADGTNWTQISAGPLNLPLARGSETLGLDPATAPMQEVLFSNNRAFTSYRITFNNTRNNSAANSLQFAELQLLGTLASGVSPSLSITRNSDGTVTLTPSEAGTLQSTTSLSATNTQWTSEGAITGPRSVPTSGQSKFFRLSVP